MAVYLVRDAAAEPRVLRAFEHMPSVEVKENGKPYTVNVELPRREGRERHDRGGPSLHRRREEGRAYRRQDALLKSTHPVGAALLMDRGYEKRAR